ncbi:nucleotide exchange factors-like protein [Punctularia strigosozonata HHB-11173 SS5]|uniref:Nucleotide exchange factors-like protein n=1 Tax=Punctularia strigosozonata (strain HHB-11173) TaxID=741275 RepID=R7S4J7_PUNST|nr:nucleotide exchange factors-like protein [Punctularia strigosozonata HHB-11173 SS5]EIN05153.1 nucleotide exchange factors-like protein [Punctularia strigosozonata HHB-11173 SS5]
MQSILRWSIENSDPSSSQNASHVEPRKIDPEIIDMILGKPDSELMKEALAIAVDESRDEDERVQALDDFEMLIEQIDNANNLEKLHMWEPLHNLLLSPTSPTSLKSHVLWILGTAVQNNPAAQHAYSQITPPPVPTLLSFLSPASTSSPKVRSRAVYALSGLLKHNVAAVRQLDREDEAGWAVLRDALEDSDVTVRRKVAFLLGALLTPTSTYSDSSPLPSASGPTLHTSPPPPPDQNSQPVHPNSHASMVADPSSANTSPLAVSALAAHGILDKLISALAHPVPHGADGEHDGRDADFEEKVVNALYTYAVVCGAPLEQGQKQALRAYLEAEAKGEAGTHSWGLTDRELRALKTKIRD